MTYFLQPPKLLSPHLPPMSDEEYEQALHHIEWWNEEYPEEKQIEENFFWTFFWTFKPLPPLFRWVFFYLPVSFSLILTFLFGLCSLIWALGVF